MGDFADWDWGEVEAGPKLSDIAFEEYSPFMETVIPSVGRTTLDEIRAQNQSNFDKIKTGALSLLSSMGQYSAQTPGYLIGAAAWKVLSNKPEEFNDYVNNAYVKYVAEMNRANKDVGRTVYVPPSVEGGDLMEKLSSVSCRSR